MLKIREVAGKFIFALTMCGTSVYIVAWLAQQLTPLP